MTPWSWLTRPRPIRWPSPSNNYGRINIGPGGTVRAKTILFGGPSKGSSESRITMTAGATLIVSNTIAGSDGALPELNMSDSILMLHLNGTTLRPTCTSPTSFAAV